MGVAAQKGLRVRPFNTCLMFAPPSDARRCLFTLWAKPEGGGIAAYVTTGAFAEFFPLERTQVAKALGPEGWRHLGESEFDAFLRGVEALDLGS
jgi:hypothetical protein